MTYGIGGLAWGKSLLHGAVGALAVWASAGGGPCQEFAGVFDLSNRGDVSRGLKRQAGRHKLHVHKLVPLFLGPRVSAAVQHFTIRNRRESPFLKFLKSSLN